MIKNVAVIGSGISGLGAAYLMSPHARVTLYEKNASIGGHTRTRTVRYGDADIAVDTGFIVYNEVNYPELTELFRRLQVDTQPSDMSFGFSLDEGAFEWGARNLNAVFGQRRNLLRPGFYRLLADVRRFFRTAPEAAAAHPDLTLDELLDYLRLGRAFRERFILPMGAAIWSCPADTIRRFPAAVFIRFFVNHGLLSLRGQHPWRTVTGGARQYVERILSTLPDVRPRTPVVAVERHPNTPSIITADGERRSYDAVIIAAHADEALQMLTQPEAADRAVLGAFGYQDNRAYLHGDISLMPKRAACRSAWNYLARSNGDQTSVSVTYDMNRLQSIDPRYPLFVTLNPLRLPDPEKTFDVHLFRHPVFTRESVAAQQRIPELQGRGGVFFCGAYQRYGFHEDGLRSAVQVMEHLGLRST